MEIEPWSDCSPSTVAICKAIVKVMEETGYVQKKGRNDFHRYNYIQEADLIEAIRPAMITNGLCYMPRIMNTMTRIRTTEKGKELAVTTLEVQYTLYHVSGEWIRASVNGQGEDEGDKGGYKAMTGATKYFLHKAFMIATGDDPERETAPEPAAPKKDADPTAGFSSGDPGEYKDHKESEKKVDPPKADIPDPNAKRTRGQMAVLTGLINKLPVEPAKIKECIAVDLKIDKPTADYTVAEAEKVIDYLKEFGKEPKTE